MGGAIRRVAALAAASVALTTTPALGAAPPALAGTTTVVATRTASLTVRLPRTTAVTLNDVSVNVPRGRMAAFAVKRVGGWDEPVVAVVHDGYCASPGCATAFPKSSLGFVRTPGGSDGLSGTLPAGTYRVYVVTDGAPFTVSLTLRGLRGSVSLRPNAPARGEVVAPAPSVAQPPASPQLFAGGSTRTIGAGGGLNATGVWKDLANGVVPGPAGPCFYEGAPPTGATAAYQLPCEGGRGAIPPFLSQPHANGTGATPAGPGRFFTTTSSGYLLPPGTHGIGGYNNTTGLVNAAYVHQVWLDF